MFRKLKCCEKMLEICDFYRGLEYNWSFLDCVKYFSRVNIFYFRSILKVNLNLECFTGEKWKSCEKMLGICDCIGNSVYIWSLLDYVKYFLRVNIFHFRYILLVNLNLQSFIGAKLKCCETMLGIFDCIRKSVYNWSFLDCVKYFWRVNIFYFRSTLKELWTKFYRRKVEALWKDVGNFWLY